MLQFANSQLVRFGATANKQFSQQDAQIAAQLQIDTISCNARGCIYLLTIHGHVWVVNINYELQQLQLPPIVQTHCKNQHVMFLTRTGHVWGMGANGYGQLVCLKI